VRDLERHVALDLREDLLPDRVGILVLLGDERRVRGHTGEHAPSVDLTDLVDACRIEEQPHDVLPLGVRVRTPTARSSAARSVACSMTRSITEASAWSKLKFG